MLSYQSGTTVMINKLGEARLLGAHQQGVIFNQFLLYKGSLGELECNIMRRYPFLESARWAVGGIAILQTDFSIALSAAKF